MSCHQEVSGNEDVEQEILVVGPAVTHLDPERLMPVGALGVDDAVNVKGGTDAECVPGAIRVPGCPRRLHPERRRDRGKRVGHPDLTGIIEDEGVGVVEAQPHLARALPTGSSSRQTPRPWVRARAP